MHGNELRLGLIGAGRWGKRYIETIRGMSGVRLAVVVSRNEETTHLVPDAAVVSDWRDLVAGDLDGVVIATPPATHSEILRSMVSAGIPTMVEKPLCLDLTEALALRDLVRKSKVLILVDHTHLFHPAFTTLKVHGEALGPVRFVRSEGAAFGPFRPGVSVLWDWAPHDVSLCLDLLNRVPDRVSALGDDGSVTVWLQFDNDTGAWITCSNLSLQKRRLLTVYFEHHALVFDDSAIDKLREYKVDFEGSPKNFTVDSGNVLPVPQGMPLTCAVSYFEQGIRGGDTARFGLDLACDVIRTIDTAQRAIDQSQPQMLLNVPIS